jgi:hypothetical protein
MVETAYGPMFFGMARPCPSLTGPMNAEPRAPRLDAGQGTGDTSAVVRNEQEIQAK